MTCDSEGAIAISKKKKEEHFLDGFDFINLDNILNET